MIYFTKEETDMKIEVIEKIRLFIEKMRLRRLSDKALMKELEQKLEEEETDNLHNIVGYVEDKDKQVRLAKEVIETPEIMDKTKQKVIEKLPQQVQRELFKESIKTKELLAKKDIDKFLKIIIKDKNLDPYDELYYRLDKAFSDVQLTYMFDKIRKERPEDYNEEKILGIIAKQIATKMRKYEMFFPSHLEQLTNEVIINRNQEEERTFNILNQKDRERLRKAMKEEAEAIKESEKYPITLKEKERITPEKIEGQIDKLVQFARERQEELRLQGVKKPNEKGLEQE